MAQLLKIFRVVNIENKTILFSLLLLIILLGTFLRVNKLLESPPSLFVDEADVGYQAYSLLKTQKDYFGNFLPTHVRSFADNRTPLYIYAAVPTVSIFGLNELAVRLPALIFGIINIPMLFWLVKNLNLVSSEKEKTMQGLLAAFLLAVLPWHIHYSRIAFEVTLLLLFTTVGIGFFFKWINKRKFLYLIFSLVFILLTPYIYSTAKLFTPLLIISVLLIYSKSIIKLPTFQKAILLIMGIILTIPMLKDLILGSGSERFSILSIFSDTNNFASYMHYQWLSSYSSPYFPFIFLHPITISKLFLNHPINDLYLTLNSYLGSFSPQFLVTSGDPNIRHSLMSSGVAGLSITILFVSGLIKLFSAVNSSTKSIVILLLILSPLPSSITRDGNFHATRLFLLILPLIITASFGASVLLSKVPKSKTLALLFIPFITFFTWEMARDQFLRLNVYPIASYTQWNGGWKEAINKTTRLAKNFDYVIIDNFDGGPNQTLFAFYKSLDPKEFQVYTAKPKYHLADLNLPVQKYSKDNISFADIDGNFFLKQLKHKVLALVPSDALTESNLNYIKIIDQVNDPFGKPQFYLVTSSYSIEKIQTK